MAGIVSTWHKVVLHTVEAEQDLWDKFFTLEKLPDYGFEDSELEEESGQAMYKVLFINNCVLMFNHRHLIFEAKTSEPNIVLRKEYRAHELWPSFSTRSSCDDITWSLIDGKLVSNGVVQMKEDQVADKRYSALSCRVNSSWKELGVPIKWFNFNYSNRTFIRIECCRYGDSILKRNLYSI